MEYKSRYVGTGANGTAVYVVEDENGDRQVRPGSKAHGSKLFSAQEASAFIDAQREPLRHRGQTRPSRRAESR